MTKQGQGYVLAKRYRIERRIGSGTSATVFEALDTHTGQRVAVKVVHHLFRKDRTIRKRFLREAQAARALVTPHAVKVLDVGELPQRIPYLVMELLTGSTLERIIRRERSGMAVEDALRLADQVAAALQDAHGMDIIHRDLKPENIFVVDVDGESFIKIVDFGISKLIGGHEVSQLTGTGVMVGTPVYMAPEQIEGWKDIDGRVDVYALGVVLYEMLAGVSPFASAKDFPGLLRLLLGEPPSLLLRRPDIPEKLAMLIQQAMMPDRAQRLSNMESLRVGLAPYWSGRRPTMHSYDKLSPSTDPLLRLPSVASTRDPSGPDLGEFFTSPEQGSATHRRALEGKPTTPKEAREARQDSPSKRAPPPPPVPYRRTPRLPTPSTRPPAPSIHPSSTRPPAPSVHPPSTRPPAPPIRPPSARPPAPPIHPPSTRPPAPPLAPPIRPPASSESQLVRPPMESGFGLAPRPTKQDERRGDDTDLRWPPDLEDHDEE